MTLAVALAGLAGALGVIGAWEGLAAIERTRATAALAGLVAPLLRAGRAGRAPTVAERRRLALLAAGTLLAGGWLLVGPLAGLALAAGGPWLAVVLVRARRRRYARELEHGAPAVARALADALAGGHSIRGAIEQVATVDHLLRRRGSAGPAAAQLRAAAAALAVGESLERALERLRAPAGGGAFELIAATVLLQRRAGGDLSQALRGVADALEEAQRLERDAHAATAQARFTGLLVTALPAAAAALAELASPGYLGSLLRSPLTAWLAGCALTLQLAALLVIRRLGRPRR